MFVIRPVHQADLKTIVRFSEQQSGLTTLQNDESLLNNKIRASEKSFSKEASAPEEEFYFFGLEDLSKKQLVGTSAILARMGWEEPAHFYRMRQETRHSKSLNRQQQITVLTPVTIHKGPSEICTLYLDHGYRGSGVGRLLSLCRFLFIASHRHRFTAEIVAEMRGVIDKAHLSPFYEAVGHHFFGEPFEELIKEVAKGTSFIEDLFPPHSVIVEMLPQAAQEVLQKTHPNTEPALKLLQKEGFHLSGDVDIFDGGPKIIAETDKIRACAESVAAHASQIVDKIDDGTDFLICNGDIDFRACQAQAKINDDGNLTITRDTAQALKIKEGDSLRYVTPRATNPGTEAKVPR